MKKLRLLVTSTCNRKCAGCCNKEWDLQSLPISNLSELSEFDELIITGGEPLLFPEETVGLAASVKKLYPHIKIYLYTAHVTAFWETFMRFKTEKNLEFFDGFHITIHEDASEIEIDTLRQLQLFHYIFKEKSMRLQIFPDVNHRITIYPRFWKRITFNPWIENCPLPQNEVFAQYSNLFKRSK